MICEKITYNSLIEARDAASGMNKQKRGRLRAYGCHECGLFHLATEEKTKKNNFRKKVVKKPQKRDAEVINKNHGVNAFMQRSEVKTQKIATYTIGEMINLKYKK